MERLRIISCFLLLPLPFSLRARTKLRVESAAIDGWLDSSGGLPKITESPAAN